MPKVELDPSTFKILAITARLSGVTEGAIVARLVNDVLGPDGSADPSGGSTPPSDDVDLTSNAARLPDSGSSTRRRIFAVYKGRRFEGEVDERSGHVRIIDAPVELDTYEFDSPTAAAVEVVIAVNPNRRKPETNGRLFWLDLDTGRQLRDFMGKR